MKETPPQADLISRIVVRAPTPLKATLTESARAARRSLSAEIVTRLERTLTPAERNAALELQEQGR